MALRVLRVPSATTSQLCPLHPQSQSYLRFPKQVSYLSGGAHAVHTAWNTSLLLPSNGGSAHEAPICLSPRSSLCRLVSSVTAPIQLCWLSAVHGSAWSPSLRAPSVSCPFRVPGVLCEQVLGLSAERIGQWLLEESWVRPAGVWPEGPLVESLGCGDKTRAIARNLGQGLRSGESRPRSQVGGWRRLGTRGSWQGGALGFITRSQTLSTC